MKKISVLFTLIMAMFVLLSFSASAKITDSTGNDVTAMAVTTKQTGDEVLETYSVSFTNTDYLSASFAGNIIPITVGGTGEMFFDFSEATVAKTCYIELYKEQILETQVGYTRSIYEDDTTGKLTFSIPSAGTYYLAIGSYTSEYADPYSNAFKMNVYFASNEDRQFANNVWTTASYKQDGTYFSFTLTKLSTVTINSDSDINIKLTDANKKELQSYSTYLRSDKNGYCASYTLKKGTYYIKALGNYGEIYKIKSNIADPVVPKNNTFIKTYHAVKEIPVYVKFKAAKSGYITLTAKNYWGSVTLCNAKLKALSKDAYVNTDYKSNQVTFGVTKGKTYYLALNNDNPWGEIKIVNKQIKDTSGVKKAKAKTIKVGSTYKGFISSYNGKTDWYKFTLSKPQYWRLNMTGGNTGNLKFTVYKANGEKIGTYSFYEGEKTFGLYSQNKWTKGTYYLSVSRADKKASGYYSMKMKMSNKQIKK